MSGLFKAIIIVLVILIIFSFVRMFAIFDFIEKLFDHHKDGMCGPRCVPKHVRIGEPLLYTDYAGSGLPGGQEPISGRVQSLHRLGYP